MVLEFAQVCRWQSWVGTGRGARFLCPKQIKEQRRVDRSSWGQWNRKGHTSEEGSGPGQKET